MEEKNRLGYENIGKLLWSFAIPSIVSMVINALYGVVDRIFVGRGVGSLAIAGVIVSFPIMLMLMAFGVLVGYGGASAISIYLGQRSEERRVGKEC
jgi:Na+-driven multidrug efflux pump